MTNETQNPFANTFKPLMKKYIVPFLIGLSPTISVDLLNNYANLKSEKIIDKSHLEIIVNQEKKKFDIEDKNINVSFDDAIRTSHSKKTGENVYEIHLSKNQRSVGILEHEFYHIANGHCDKPYNALKYLFIQEPQAAIYGATGVKL